MGPPPTVPEPERYDRAVWDYNSANLKVRWCQAPGDHGTQVEDLIALVLDRLTALDIQQTCIENRLALVYLSEGLKQLNLRTLRRRAQGVEGTQEPHVSAPGRKVGEG